MNAEAPNPTAPPGCARAALDAHRLARRAEVAP